MDCARTDAATTLCRLLDGPQPQAPPPADEAAPGSAAGPRVAVVRAAAAAAAKAGQPPDASAERLLAVAAEGGAQRCLAALLARGVPVDACQQEPPPQQYGYVRPNERPCGYTALSAAIDGGQLEAARALLSAGARVGGVPLPPGFFEDERSWARRWAAPPLGLAIKRRHVALVRLLLERGADANQLWQERGSSYAWWCPLTAAVQGPGVCCESRAQQAPRSCTRCWARAPTPTRRRRLAAAASLTSTAAISGRRTPAARWRWLCCG